MNKYTIIGTTVFAIASGGTVIYRNIFSEDAKINRAKNKFAEIMNQKINSFISSKIEEIKIQLPAYLEENHHHRILLFDNEWYKSKMETQAICDLYDKKIFQVYTSIRNNLSDIHLTALMQGKTGTGKSTTVNTISGRKPGNEIAPTDILDPVTMDFDEYIIENNPWLRIIDSRGIETEGYDPQTAINKVKQFIQGRLLQDDADKHIHVIWYFINSYRFENCEVKYLKELIKTYSNANLPVIIIYNDVEKNKDKAKKMKEGIKNKCDFRGEINYVIISAIDANYGIQEDDIDVLFGIPKLIELTKSKVNTAIKNSCYESARKRILENYESSCNEKLEQFKQKIRNSPDLKTNDIPLFTSALKSLIYEVIDSFLKEINLGQNEKMKFKDEIDKLNFNGFFDTIKGICRTFEEIYIHPSLKELSGELCDSEIEIQNNYHVNWDNLLMRDELFNNLKPEIDSKMKNKIESILFEKACLIAIENFFNHMQEISYKNYENSIKNNEDRILEDIQREVVDKFKLNP